MHHARRSPVPTCLLFAEEIILVIISEEEVHVSVDVLLWCQSETHEQTSRVANGRSWHERAHAFWWHA